MKQQLSTAIFVLFLITAGAAMAADGIVIRSGSVDFAAADGSAGVATVAGPEGFQYRQEFDAGSVATMSLYDEAGNGLADGAYTWQVTMVKGEAPAERDAYAGKGESLSGAFTIQYGSVVDPDVAEGSTNKDQVFLDDLIVDGSACIGQDCVNGESFGFDTIRLKENNLRIRFQDTSSSSSFPTNDWQITANDSANGGAEKFSIDDIDGGKTPMTIEAGAPSHSLYVDDGGRLGLGTSTPVVDAHVKSGNTPTLRLEQDGSSGFTPQTWDVAGNEANFFVRDATNGSTLPFQIKPGAPTASIYVAADGDVGLGTSSPGTHENGGDDVAMHILSTSTDDGGLLIENTALGTDVMLELRQNGTPRFDLIDTNTSTEWRFAASASGFKVIDLSDSGTEEFSLATNGNLTVSGQLYSAGTTCSGGCDKVFQPEYELESIEEHAAFMWQNSYLDSVGPTEESAARWSITEMTGGILNELEKAHIYIDQLNQRLVQLEQQLAAQE